MWTHTCSPLPPAACGRWRFQYRGPSSHWGGPGTLSGDEPYRPLNQHTQSFIVCINKHKVNGDKNRNRGTKDCVKKPVIGLGIAVKTPEKLFLLELHKGNYLHLSNVCLQPGDSILVTSSLVAHAILHVSHLAQQRFVLHGNRGMRWGRGESCVSSHNVCLLRKKE